MTATIDAVADGAHAGDVPAGAGRADGVRRAGSPQRAGR